MFKFFPIQPLILCLFLDFIVRTVHHSRVSVVVVLHNLFTKNFRTASLSADYLALFNFARDKSVVSSLGKQMFPERNRFLKHCYDFVTRKPYGYLFIDLTGLQNNRFRIRSNIFNDPETLILAPV